MEPLKFAIFYCEAIPRLFALEDSAKKVGFETYSFHYKDIRVAAGGSGVDLQINGVSLKDFSLVFCMGFWSYQFEMALLADFCVKNKIPLLDKALQKNQIISKMHDLFKFKLEGLAVPKTIFPQGSAGAGEICAELDFPIVAKENRSRFGENVHLLKNKKELSSFLGKVKYNKKNLDTPLYKFQEFIPADFDMRIIVIGGKIIGAIERRSTRQGEFRHNLSLGGTAKQIEISGDSKAMAVKAAKILNYQFAGVDLITNKHTGKTYIIEVNRSPEFKGFVQATGIDVPLELMKFFLRACKK